MTPLSRRSREKGKVMADPTDTRVVPTVSDQDLRRAILYITDAMFAMTDALDRIAERTSSKLGIAFGADPFLGLDVANLHSALRQAQQRLDSVVNLLAEDDAP
jgi:hypothetical protein